MKWANMTNAERLTEVSRMAIEEDMSASAIGERLGVGTKRRASTIFAFAAAHDIHIVRRSGGMNTPLYPATMWNASEERVRRWIEDQDAAFSAAMTEAHPELAR